MFINGVTIYLFIIIAQAIYWLL